MEKKGFSKPSCPRWEDFPDIELYMDQVIFVLEKHLAVFFPEEKSLTSTMINNYVKQKLVQPPRNKRYERGQLARLFSICILKSFMQLSDVRDLMENLENGRGEREVYELFADQMQRALGCVFGAEDVRGEMPDDPNEGALLSALIAVASIIESRRMLCLAKENWPVRAVSDSEKKDKAEKKEKKEKKK
ncbi:MAG: DUF1836 domain-containing protein [Clostridia bacterium]|nr:DUF1836 domain-containing protein [Clostridia bacterium]